jgi:diguanylate cyclase (GGDEF)-like protein
MKGDLALQVGPAPVDRDSVAGADIEAEAPNRLRTLSDSLRDNAWELAVEAVQEGMVSGTVPSLGELSPLDRVGDIPAFIGELAREIADPHPARFDGAGPLLELARAHARNREALGFTPREVLMEFLLLRRVLWRALSREPELIEGSDPFLVQSRLDGAVDVLVVEFAVAFFDRATHALAEQARTDPLTGLLNHQAFWGEVGTELERASRYRHELTLVYLDVDDFKGINDRYGHPAGDRVLRAVAAVLLDEARDSDVIGRTGGDEFAACLVESEPDGGARFIARLRGRVAGLSLDRGMPPVLSITAGSARFPAEAGSADALFELADARLYAAKRSK